jgi:predicted dehydrogenase
MGSQDKILNVIVVGAGHLGGFHAQKYASLAAEGVRIAAFVDPAVDAVKAKLSTKFPGIPVFASVDECFKKVKEIDAASVATSTEHHVEVGIQLLDKGVHLLVEKPLAMDSKSALKLVEYAEKKKLVLATGQVERHRVMEVVRALKGSPKFIECHRLSPFPARSTDIDVIFDLMIHDIDLMLAMVKSEVTEVRAAGVPVLTNRIDIANARIEFANGCVANLTSSRISITRTRKFRVFLADGYLSLDLALGSYNRYGKKPNETDLAKAITHEEGTLTVEDPLLAEIQDFLRAVRDGTGPLVSGRDGLKAIEVAELVVRDIEGRKR